MDLPDAEMPISRVSILPIKIAHALHVATLPHPNRDPFDRMLIAQTQIEDLTLSKADRAFAAYDVEIA